MTTVPPKYDNWKSLFCLYIINDPIDNNSGGPLFMKAHPSIRCIPSFSSVVLAQFMQKQIPVSSEIITLQSLGSSSYPFKYNLSELYLILFDKSSLIKYYEGKLTTDNDWFSLLVTIS